MTIALITPPIAEPVTVQQLMLQMGFGTVADGTLEATLNAQLTTAICAARAGVEDFLRRVLITQHWLLRRDEFSHRGIDLPKPPFQSIDWFRYVDTNANVDQLLQDTTYGQNFPAPYGYQLDRGSETQYARLFPPWAKPWPPTLRVPSSVMVQFRCGYGGPIQATMTQGSAVLTLANGITFNPDDAPLMMGDTGLPIVIQGAGSVATDGIPAIPLVTNIASVSLSGVATLAAPAQTAVSSAQGWAGYPVPSVIIKAILLLAQFFYEQASVGGEIPSYIKEILWPWRNLVA